MKTFAFIDASNLFYGGEKNLDWKIDYQKLLKYLRGLKKEIIILARGNRTAKEIRQLAGGNFKDFVRLKKELEFEENHH